MPPSSLIFFLVISVYLATLFATRWKNGRAYVGSLGYVAGILGAVLIITLPRHNRVGLLCSYWVGGAFLRSRAKGLS